MLLSQVVLLGLESCLASLLMLAHQNGLLDLGLLNVALLAERLDALLVLLRKHHIILHLLSLDLHALIVPLLELEDFRCALLRLLNLLPRLDLFLLEEGDTVSEELGITVHTATNETQRVRFINQIITNRPAQHRLTDMSLLVLNQQLLTLDVPSWQ